MVGAWESHGVQPLRKLCAKTEEDLYSIDEHCYFRGQSLTPEPQVWAAHCLESAQIFWQVSNNPLNFGCCLLFDLRKRLWDCEEALGLVSWTSRSEPLQTKAIKVHWRGHKNSINLSSLWSLRKQHGTCVFFDFTMWKWLGSQPLRAVDLRDTTCAKQMWSEILRCSGVAEIPKHQIETSPSRCTPRVASTTYRAFSLEIAETAASPYSLAWCCPAQWLEWIELVDLPKHGEPDLTKMFLVVPFSSISSTSSKCLQLSELAGSQSHCIYTRRVTDQLEKLVWCNSSVRRFVRCIWVWLHHITSFFRGSEFSWIQSQTVYLEVAESKARMMPEQMANPASNAKMTLAESAVQISPDSSAAYASIQVLPLQPCQTFC